MRAGHGRKQARGRPRCSAGPWPACRPVVSAAACDRVRVRPTGRLRRCPGVRGCWRSCDGIRSAGVRSTGVRRGHCGQGMSAATGSGRLAGVRWWGAATAARPAGAAGQAAGGAARARRSWPAAPAPPRRSARQAEGPVGRRRRRVLVPDRVDELAGEHHPVGGRARAGSPACAAAARPPRRARRNRPVPPTGRARRWSRRWPRPPLCRGDAAKGARAASAGGPSSTGGARTCRDRPHPTAPWPPGKVAPLMVTVTEPGAGSIGRSPNLCRFSPSSSPSRPGRAAWRTASPRRGWRRRPSRRCAGCARRPSSGRSAACRRCP